MELNDNLGQALRVLEDSKKHTGQSLEQIIRGVSNQQTLTYWDYIKLDTLLSLQAPQTNYPDEKLFLIYHQITELYLKLIIHELTALTNTSKPSIECWKKHITRVNQHLKVVLNSLDMFSEQLEYKEFSEFRLSLAPASGFQSYQFRHIELMSTTLHNLISSDIKLQMRSDANIEAMYQNIYWKFAGRELHNNKKSHMLVEFEKKYDKVLIDLAQNYANRNIWSMYKDQISTIQCDNSLQSEMRDFDYNFNIAWSLKHYKLAAKHLKGSGAVDKSSTGGTNWRKFLPPKNQKITFFPGLWSLEEHSTWGNQNKLM
jgi:tryptophan 2,3-dioxygenase